MNTLPQIRIGKLELSRLALGGNPISGFSHQGQKRDRQMVDYFTAGNTKRLFRDCEAQGINALFARADHFISRVLNEYWHEGGTIQWIAQTAPERKDQLRNIHSARGWGAKAIYIHGGMVDEYWEQARQEELRAYVDEIRGLGVPAGLASHNPDTILEVERLGWPLDFYMVCLYRLGGYKGRVRYDLQEEFDDRCRLPALNAIAQVGRTCFAYKILGAGRRDPRQAMTEVFGRLKPTDGVVVGMFPRDNPQMVAENAGLLRELSEQEHA